MNNVRKYTLGGLASLALGAATGIGIKELFYRNPASQPVATVPSPVEQSSLTLQRQTRLDSLASELSLPYVVSIEYDGDGTKNRAYLEELSRLYTPVGEKPGLLSPSDVGPNSTGDYIFSIVNPHRLIGQGQKSRVFIGRKLFDDRVYSSFTDLAIKDTLLASNRFAQRHHSGYESIDSQLLRNKIDNGEVSPFVLYCVAEIDADAYSLRSSPVRAQLPEYLRQQHANNLALNLGVLKQFYLRGSPFTQHFIRTVLENNGILIQTPRVPVPTPKK